jgi:hypothetical protein
MNQDITKVFNLSKNYTKEELKNALTKKIDQIKNMNIPNFDKKILIDQYYQKYLIAKNNIHNNQLNLLQSNIFNHSHLINQFTKNLEQNLFNTNFDNTNFDNKNMKGYSYSYKSISSNNPNENVVVETKNTFNNGKINKKISSYKIDSNGNKIPIEYNNAIN